MYVQCPHCKAVFHAESNKQGSVSGHGSYKPVKCANPKPPVIVEQEAKEEREKLNPTKMWYQSKELGWGLAAAMAFLVLMGKLNNWW